MIVRHPLKQYKVLQKNQLKILSRFVGGVLHEHEDSFCKYLPYSNPSPIEIGTNLVKSFKNLFKLVILNVIVRHPLKQFKMLQISPFIICVASLMMMI